MPLLSFFWGFFGSSLVIHPPRYQPTLTPGDFKLPWRPLRLKTSDHVEIDGWFIPHPHGSGILLLLHGFGTSKADLLDLAQALHAGAQFHLVLIDFRGHGFSGGTAISFGKREIGDIRAVLDYLLEEPSLARLPVGCFGISMGGSIGILAAAEFPEIRAIASDSAYSDLGLAIARAIGLSYHIPRFPLGQIVVWVTELRLGCRMGSLSPHRVIEKISPRALLIVHGTNDKTTPSREAEVLFQAARQPKELWLVKDAEHVGAFYKMKGEYLNRMVDFFQNGLLRKT